MITGYRGGGDRLGANLIRMDASHEGIWNDGHTRTLAEEAALWGGGRRSANPKGTGRDRAKPDQQVISVVSVVVLPPTLVASIYGMNFQIMPELNWPWGYPAALVVIILSAVLPFVVFRHKGWP